MKVVILCGGQGTRIRDIANDIPKPMIRIGSNPILWHIMKGYAAAGHTDFVLCLGHLGHVIKEFFLHFEAFTRDFTVTCGAEMEIQIHGREDTSPWRVALAETGVNALTGTRVQRIQRYVEDDENFMLTYGDGLTDMDLGGLIAFHQDHGKIVTVTGVRPPSRFGEIVSDETGKVTSFDEKPPTSGGHISGGFFVCRREVFDYLDEDRNIAFEQEPIRKMVEDGEMMIYPHDGFWQCMDTARDLALLNGLWENGKAPWKTWR